MLPPRTVLAFALLPAVLAGAPAARAEMAADEKREIERIVRDYILTNPEVVEKALMALEEQRREKEAAEQSQAIAELKDKLYNSRHQAVVGNASGKVAMVEFFDYNCGYCKRALTDMLALMEENPDLRVVLKEFPILSEGSLEAAKVSVAVSTMAPEKYLDFHREMFDRAGQANKEKALAIAADLGLEKAAVEAASEKPEVIENLSEVQGLARALKMSGTPSYVVGEEAVFGAVGFDELQAKLEAQRKKG